MAKIRSDAHLYLTETGDGASVPEPITTISSANPAVVTFGSPHTDVKDGDMIVISETGLPELDGVAFRMRNPAVDGSTAELEGLDGSDLSGSIGSGAMGAFYHLSETLHDGDLLAACVATVTVTGQAPDELHLDDMCTSTIVLGTAKPPTFQFTGWVDNDSDGFANLVQASLENPKTERYLLIDYGPEGGYIFGPVQIGEISVTAGVNAGLAYTGAGVFTEMPTYSWAI